MSKYLQIQIPKACSQNWEEMNVEEHGRNCNSCQKNVIDFTLMDDIALTNFFKKNKENVCGRFKEDQLNHDIIIPAKKIPWLKYFFQISIPAFLFSLKSEGQAKKISDQIYVADTKKVNNKSTIKTNTTKISDCNVIDPGKPVSKKSREIMGDTVIFKAAPFKISNK